ncbi:MAG: hypothetical protein F6K14_31185 [Symploca sp. SIO2C1]|nr:hypothetical protein [Symploca sp. SIO2C1]
MSYPKIGFTTLITCLSIVLTPRVLIGATINLPEFSPSAQGDGFEKTEITRQIANQLTESTEPIVPAPVPPLILNPPPRFCLIKPTFLARHPLRRLVIPTRRMYRSSNFSSKVGLLSQIALQYASIGQSDQALQSAQAIKDEYAKVDTLIEIAQLYVEAGEPEVATPILSQALPLVPAIKDESIKVDTLIGIAQLYIESREPELATPILLQALPLVQNFKTDYRQTTLLTSIAVKLTEAGQLSQALQVANTQKPEDEKVNTLVEIAIKLAQIGQLSQALEIAQGLNKFSQFRVWSKSAEHYIKTGQHNQAIQLAQNVNDYCDQAEILYKVVGYLLDAEQYELALQNAQIIEYRPRKDKALRDIAIKLAQAGKFDQALPLAQSIESVQNRAEALTQIATHLVEAGQQSKASEILSQALEITESINTEQLSQPKPLPIRRESVPLPNLIELTQ